MKAKGKGIVRIALMLPALAGSMLLHKERKTGIILTA